MSLDHDEKTRLWSAGFVIDRSSKVAQVAGSMSVYVSREHQGSDLYVMIVMPNGSRLGCTATRGAVLGINRGMRVTIDDHEEGW